MDPSLLCVLPACPSSPESGRKSGKHRNEDTSPFSAASFSPHKLIGSTVMQPAIHEERAFKSITTLWETPLFHFQNDTFITNASFLSISNYIWKRSDACVFYLFGGTGDGTQGVAYTKHVHPPPTLHLVLVYFSLPNLTEDVSCKASEGGTVSNSERILLLCYLESNLYSPNNTVSLHILIPLHSPSWVIYTKISAFI